MTGEQKPGGLEVVGWIKRTNENHPIGLAQPGGLEVAGHVVWWKEGGLSFIQAGEPVSVGKSCRVEPLTPAEPAEARIRELEAERDTWKALAENAAQALPQYVTRATAAEAKLARVAETIKKAKDLDVAKLHDGYDSGAGGGNYVYADVVRTADLFPLLDQTLAALQQGTQDQ